MPGHSLTKMSSKRHHPKSLTSKGPGLFIEAALGIQMVGWDWDGTLFVGGWSPGSSIGIQ